MSCQTLPEKSAPDVKRRLTRSRSKKSGAAPWQRLPRRRWAIRSICRCSIERRNASLQGDRSASSVSIARSKTLCSPISNSPQVGRQAVPRKTPAGLLRYVRLLCRCLSSVDDSHFLGPLHHSVIRAKVTIDRSLPSSTCSSSSRPVSAHSESFIRCVKRHRRRAPAESWIRRTRTIDCRTVYS